MKRFTGSLWIVVRCACVHCTISELGMTWLLKCAHRMCSLRICTPVPVLAARRCFLEPHYREGEDRVVSAEGYTIASYQAIVLPYTPYSTLHTHMSLENTHKPIYRNLHGGFITTLYTLVHGFKLFLSLIPRLSTANSGKPGYEASYFLWIVKS